MTWSDVRIRLRALFRRRAVEDELDAELRFHFEKQVEQFLASGDSPPEARRRAALLFGGLQQMKEDCRDARGLGWFEIVRQDLRYGLRGLRRNPGFTTVAVLSLALGIGANAVVFSLLDQALLKSLPVSRPAELVVFRSPGPSPGMRRKSARGMSFSYPKYRDLRDQAAVFRKAVAAWYPVEANLSVDGHGERVSSELVTGNFFEVLGIRPAAGRLLSPEDDRTWGAHPVAVLSYEFWQRRFAGSTSAIGKAVVINDRVFTIIGVSPSGFHSLDRGQTCDLRAPMMMKATFTPTWPGIEERFWAWLNIVARLAPGVELTQAEAGANVIYHQILENEGATLQGVWLRQKEEFLKRRIELIPAAGGSMYLADQQRTFFWALMGMVALVLLIASVNVANLLMARTVARRRELAIRVAIGAGKARIAAQLASESLLLGLVGGTLGLLSAWLAQPFATRFLFGEDGARFFAATPDFRVLGFTVAVSLATTLLFGILPALRRSAVPAAESLKAQSGGSAGTGHARFRAILVTAQIALCVWLTLCAALFARTLSQLRNVDPGFRRDHLVTFAIDPSLGGYPPKTLPELYQRLEKALAAVPGVDSAALSNFGLFRFGLNFSLFDVEGFQSETIAEIPVTPGYVRTLGMRLVAGRDLEPRDFLRGSVVLVNQAFARKYFQGGNALGKHVHSAFQKKDVFLEIAGVVGDQKLFAVRDDNQPLIYAPALYQSGATCYLRTQLDAASMLEPLRKVLATELPRVPLYHFETLEASVGRSLRNDQVIAGLALFFGLLAVALASIGLYGVLSYTVVVRTREIGIRIALGALPGQISRMVLRDLAWMLGAGLAIGLPSAIVMGRFLESRLYGVKPTDLAAVTGTVAVVMLVSLAAALIPARRATSTDPLPALRQE